MRIDPVLYRRRGGGPGPWRDDGRETVATAGVDLDDRT
jgi:hypothetical protein